MKLYALNGVFGYEGDTLLGVYSSSEAANRAMNVFKETEKYAVFDDYFVEERELDAMAAMH